MEEREFRPHRCLGILIFVIGCAIGLSVPVAGQNGADPARARIQEMDRRELQLEGLGADKNRPNDPKRSQAIMDQIGEDFQRILTLHNEIVRAIASNRSLSDRFVADATGEIRKR